MKKNIGFLGNQIAPGGGSASLLLMIQSLPKDKYNIFLLSSDCANSMVKKEFMKYSESVVVDKRIKQFVSCAGHPPTFYEYFKANLSKNEQISIIVDFIRKNKIDILHINNAVFSHLYEQIKKRTTVIIVTHLREQVHLFNKDYLEKKIINNIEEFSDRIIAISEKEAAPFKTVSKIDIIANPFDFDSLLSINDSGFRRENNIDNNTILIGMMGRFARDKGHLLFLQSAKYFYDNYRDDVNVKFAIIGVNPPKPKWKLIIKKLLFKKDFRTEVISYIKQNGLRDNVILHPYVKNVYSILRELNIYVRPSLFSDPWGRDIIEAMALKKCVIATGDYEFFIKNNHSGFLVKEISPKAIGEKMLSIALDKEKLKDIGEIAFAGIKNKTDIHKYGSKIDNIYQMLI